MPKDIFIISGTEKVVYTPNESLKDIKESQSELLSSKEKFLTKLSTMDSQPELTDPRHPFKQILNDICRNAIIVDGEKLPIASTSNEDKQRRIKEFGLLVENDIPKYELAELHQGNAANINLHANSNYCYQDENGIKVGSFQVLKNQGTIQYEKEGDVYSYKTTSKCIYNVGNQYFAINKATNKLEVLPPEIFETIIMDEDISQLPYAPVSEMAMKVSVDYTGYPEKKPVVTVQYEVLMHHQGFKYVGSETDPNVYIEINSPIIDRKLMEQALLEQQIDSGAGENVLQGESQVMPQVQKSFFVTLLQDLGEKFVNFFRSIAALMSSVTRRYSYAQSDVVKEVDEIDKTVDLKEELNKNDGAIAKDVTKDNLNITNLDSAKSIDSSKNIVHEMEAEDSKQTAVLTDVTTQKISKKNSEKSNKTAETSSSKELSKTEITPEMPVKKVSKKALRFSSQSDMLDKNSVSKNNISIKDFKNDNTKDSDSLKPK